MVAAETYNSVDQPSPNSKGDNNSFGGGGGGGGGAMTLS